MTFRRVRNIIFLRDVLVLALTSFGGPQAHLAMFMEMMVKKRAYLSESDLIELFALCQILPGPTSTQTITSVGFKIGGPSLAYMTLIVWVMPAVIVMTAAALTVNILNDANISLDFLRFIQPMAVGIVAYSAYRIASSVVSTKDGYFLMLLSAVASFYIRSPYAFPVLLLIGGFVTAFKYKKLTTEEKKGIKIRWENFILWAAVLICAAILGGVFQSLPIKTFENFYRNGSLIFGGGQVLVPLLFTEFVEFKAYLTSEEFISGYALVQALPGPTFSFSAYLGALIMREWGVGGEILGALLAAAGIFLPGTFLIFFVARFWGELKKYRVIKASLEGISAVSSGMVIAATFYLIEPIDVNFVNYGLMFGTTFLMFFSKIPTPLIILTGLLLGFIFQ
ncbi:MAG: chromate transporter [Cyclobacteriaceae bacterium]|jgi:chromate transporter